MKKALLVAALIALGYDAISDFKAIKAILRQLGFNF